MHPLDTEYDEIDLAERAASGSAAAQERHELRRDAAVPALAHDEQRAEWQANIEGAERSLGLGLGTPMQQANARACIAEWRRMIVRSLVEDLTAAWKMVV